MGTGPEKTFSKEDTTDGQQTYEKMPNITNYQGNANQNHNGISSHICQNGYHQKRQGKCWQGCGKHGTFVHCPCDINWYCHYRKEYGLFLKN